MSDTRSDPDTALRARLRPGCGYGAYSESYGGRSPRWRAKLWDSRKHSHAGSHSTEAEALEACREAVVELGMIDEPTTPERTLT